MLCHVYRKVGDFSTRNRVVLSVDQSSTREKRKNFGLLEEADVNEVSVRSSSNPMPIGQRYGGKDLLLPFESRHHSHQSLVTVTIGG